MGAGQSNTRRLTIPNDDKNGVIKVSDSVVKRLKGSSDEASEVKRAPPSPSTTVPEQHVDNSTLPSLGVPPSHQEQHYYEPSLTTLQILQEKERQLQKNDEYWNMRVKKLRENHAEVDRVLEEEYNKASREVTKRFASNPKKNACPPPCEDCKACVLECYEKNPRNTLACAQIVQAFAACVDSSRVNVVQNAG